jgi:hypothetical protein
MTHHSYVLETFIREEGQEKGSVSGAMALSALQSMYTALAASQSRERRLREACEMALEVQDGTNRWQWILRAALADDAGEKGSE